MCKFPIYESINFHQFNSYHFDKFLFELLTQFLQEEWENSYTFMSRYRDVHVIKAASMLSPRVNAASVYFNGSLWVTGGQSNAGILDTTEWYIFAQDKWIQGPKLPMV